MGSGARTRKEREDEAENLKDSRKKMEEIFAMIARNKRGRKGKKLRNKKKKG